MEKKPWWPVALGLGALVVIGGGGGVVWWKHTARRGPKKPAAASSSMGAAASGKLAANRGSCPEGMVYVPAGTFTMGSPDNEGKADEHPAHQEKLGAFCIGGTEVTVADYRECVKEKRGDLQCTAPRVFPACNYQNPARNRHPINCVDFAQAETYCKWAGGSLPTEAQWEYAARGTDGRKYPWGNDAPSAKLVNACGAECADGKRRKPMYDKADRFPETAPVGSFPDGASAVGALDLAGNVSEWVADKRAPYPGGQPFPKDPDGGPEPGHVVRGGAYATVDANYVRGAAREGVFEKGVVTIGFRCVRSP